MSIFQKAQSWSKQVGRTPNRIPGIFRAPAGGSAYFGRGYRWQQVMEYRFWAFVAINAWIREIAGGEGPNIAYIKPKEKVEVWERSVRRKAVTNGPREHEEVDMLPADHPAVRVFSNPNGPDVAYDLWAYTTLFYCLTGMVFWWVRKNFAGMPEEIWVVPSHWVQIENLGEGEKSYYVQSPWGFAEHIPEKDMVVMSWHSPLNPRYEAAAVSQAINEWIDTYDANIRALLAQYKNGAIPAFHMELDESYGDPDDYMLDRLYAKFENRFRGENNTGRPLITGPGIKMNMLGINPVDMRYNETDERLAKSILAAYATPRALCNLTDGMTYGSNQAEIDLFRSRTINPVLTYWAQVITEKVLQPIDTRLRLWWNDRAEGDPEFRLKEEEHDIANGIRSVNEVRALRGLKPWPQGGDNPMVGGNVMGWLKPEQAQDRELDQAVEHALGTTSGGSGGYLVHRNGVFR